MMINVQNLSEQCIWDLALQRQKEFERTVLKMFSYSNQDYIIKINRDVNKMMINVQNLSEQCIWDLALQRQKEFERAVLKIFSYSNQDYIININRDVQKMMICSKLK